MDVINEDECDDFGQNVTFCPKVLLFSQIGNTNCPTDPFGTGLSQRMNYPVYR